MNISDYSKYKIHKNFDSYHVPKEYADVMYNYLVHGFSPGSFFTSVLANDCTGAIVHSHPSNTIQALKYLVVWILNMAPSICWGSYEKVEEWTKLPDLNRRTILEGKNLIYTEADEIVMVLKGEEVESFAH